MYTEKLKPCPFCGGPAEFRTEPDVDECGCCTGYGWTQVVCKECGARTRECFCEFPEKLNTAEARDAWNRRCDAPTTDPEELRLRGHWIAQDEGRTRFACSECSMHNLPWRAQYCPNCGAKMEV